MWWEKRIFSKVVFFMTLFFLISKGGVTFGEVKNGGGPGKPDNVRDYSSETVIDYSNVAGLTLKGTFQACGNIQGQPVTVDGFIYVTDNGGCVHKLDQDLNVIWTKKVHDLLLQCGGPDVNRLATRATPLIIKNKIIIPTNRSVVAMAQAFAEGNAQSAAYVLALDKDTGECEWYQKTSDHMAAVVNGTIGHESLGPDHHGLVCGGTSSLEESVSSFLAGPFVFGGTPIFYPGLTFRGNYWCLDANDGHFVWKNDTISDSLYYAHDQQNGTDAAKAAELSFPQGAPVITPGVGPPLHENGNPNLPLISGTVGNAVWGLPNMSIDLKTNTLYSGTGNNYQLSEALLTAASQRLQANPNDNLAGIFNPLDNMVESIVATDLNTGQIKWSHQMNVYDPWVIDCTLKDLVSTPPFDQLFPPYLLGAINCNWDTGRTPDADFGEHPMIIRNVKMPNHQRKDLLAVGQKSGVFYALDPATGNEVWRNDTACPGGEEGGYEFGGASDGETIYISCTNSRAVPYQLRAGQYTGVTVYGSFWVAMEAATGNIKWQSPDPYAFVPVPPLLGLIRNLGPTTYANGVVYGGSRIAGAVPGLDGNMFALDASSGHILWSYPTHATVGSGPLLTGKDIIWGAGYPSEAQSKTLYKFGLP